MSEKWIDVYEQLPPITWTMSDLVLVTDGDKICTGWYHIDDGWNCDIDSMRPTHWSPMSESVVRELMKEGGEK